MHPSCSYSHLQGYALRNVLVRLPIDHARLEHGGQRVEGGDSASRVSEGRGRRFCLHGRFTCGERIKIGTREKIPKSGMI